MKTRTRFLLLFFLAGVLSVVLYIYALGPVTRFYVQHIDSQSLSAGDLESILRRASSEITLSPGRSGFIAQAARAVHNHHPGTDGVYIQVLDSEGRVLYSNPGQDSLGPEKIRSLLASGLRFDRYTVGELGGLFTGAIEYGRFIAEAAAVPLSNEDPDAGTLVGALEFSQTTGFSLALRGEGYNLLLIAFVVGLVCVFVVTLLVIFLGTISLLRRFERLNTGLKEVLSGNYHFRLPEKGRDELASISSSFNIMITGLAKQEEERQRMEQEKRRIITSLSHDLRTPLTSVMGYAENIRDNPEDPKEEIAQQAGVIREKAEHMEGLLQELLDFSVSDAPVSQVNLEEFDFYELLRNSIIGFLPQIKEKNMPPSIEVPEKKKLVRGDKRLLSRAFENLLVNGIKHAYPGTVLSIAAAEVNESGIENILVSIGNTGPVIPESKQEKIFEAFYRTDESRKAGGLGLGLSIAKRILERHGGSLTLAESTEEQTVFQARLPAK